MKNILKNKKGFTLLEVLVTVGILGVLSAIAIPAYKQYKDTANDTAVKLEVSSGHKAYLAYEITNNTFCVTLTGAGMGSIGKSPVYSKSDNSFAGFDTATGCSSVPTTIKEVNGTLTATTCKLDDGSFTMGAAFEKTGSVSSGYFISNTASGPSKTAIAGSCTGYTATNETACIAGSGTWSSTTIADVCL